MKLDFSQKYVVRPLTAGDVDKILALCAENEQFYRYHPPLARLRVCAAHAPVPVHRALRTLNHAKPQ